MIRQETDCWGYLEIMGRVRADVNDAEWLCVKRYPNTAVEFAHDELARLRSGDSTAVRFRGYNTDDLEFRLQRVTQHTYLDIEVL